MDDEKDVEIYDFTDYTGYHLLIGVISILLGLFIIWFGTYALFFMTILVLVSIAGGLALIAVGIWSIMNWRNES